MKARSSEIKVRLEDIYPALQAVCPDLSNLSYDYIVNASIKQSIFSSRAKFLIHFEIPISKIERDNLVVYIPLHVVFNCISSMRGASISHYCNIFTYGGAKTGMTIGINL